jgi:hypothetical protein
MLTAAYRKNAEVLGRVREQEKRTQEELHDLKSAALKDTLRYPGNLKRMFAFATHPPVGLFLDKLPVDVLYGTNLGNVSHVIPCIHPMIGIGSIAPHHTAEFAVQTDTDEAYRAMLDGGVALAWSALDAPTDPAQRAYLLGMASARIGSSPRKASILVLSQSRESTGSKV